MGLCCDDTSSNQETWLAEITSGYDPPPESRKYMIAAAPAALDEAIGITKFETLGHNPCGPA